MHFLNLEEVTTYDLVKATNVVITLGGLENLNKILMEETVDLHAPKVFDRLELDSFREKFEAEKAAKHIYDPYKPLDLKFQVLKEYLKDLHEYKQLESAKHDQTKE